MHVEGAALRKVAEKGLGRRVDVSMEGAAGTGAVLAMRREMQRPGPWSKETNWYAYCEEKKRREAAEALLEEQASRIQELEAGQPKAAASQDKPKAAKRRRRGSRA